MKTIKHFIPALIGLFLFIFSLNTQAAVHYVKSQDYIELELSRGEALGQSVYIPSLSIGGFRYGKSVPFQITLGFLNKDLVRQRDAKTQELKDFFFVGPQYVSKFSLTSKVSSELGLAILTGNLSYRTQQIRSSSSRSGLFLAIQPKAKLLFAISKKFSVYADLHYILSSVNQDDGGADIGPALGLGSRWMWGF